MKIQFLRQRVGIRNFVASITTLTLLFFAIRWIRNDYEDDDYHDRYIDIGISFVAGVSLIVLVVLNGALRGNAALRRVLIVYGCGLGTVLFCIMVMMPFGVFVSFCLLVLAYGIGSYVGYCGQRQRPVMKFKWRLWSGPTFAAVVLAWCVLAYIFMWRPVIWEYWSLHRDTPISSASACINNLRDIDAAISQWTLDHGKHTDDPVTLEELKPYFFHGEIPTCPFGGIYSVTVVGAPPTCSLGTSYLKELSLGKIPPVIRIRRDYFYYEEDNGEHILP
jgi:hypothetical protein